MEYKIVSLPFSRLLKIELRKVALEVIRIVETHDPELLQIKPMYDVLLAEKPNVDALDVPYKGHPASKILKRLRKERNVHVRSIKFELRKIIDLDPTGDDKTVVLLKNEIDRFLKDFYDSKNDLLRNEKLDMFLAKADTNEALYDALESKGFINLLDNLKMNLSDVIDQINKRTKSKSNRPTVKTEVLRKQVIKAVRNMLDDIYLAQFKNPALDYSSLFNELNEMLKSVGWLVNIRLSNNEKKAAKREKAKNNETTAEPTSLEVQSETAGSDNSYHSSQVYVASIKNMNGLSGETSPIVSDNGSLESEDQKKAVASDWSSVQQLEEEKDTSRS